MTPSRHPQHTRAVMMLLVANFFWGLSFPVIKAVLLLHERMFGVAASWFSSFYTVAPRFVLATLVLLPWFLRSGGRVTRAECRQGFALGLFAAAGMLLQNDGLQFTHASTSAFLTQFYAILIPLWVAWRTRRSPGARVWTCCVLVLAGVAILGRFDWQELRLGRGEWETLVASVFFMGQILWLEKAEFAGNRPLAVTLVMFATEATVFSAGAWLTAPSTAALWVPWTSAGWVALTLVLTFACTLGAFLLMNTWQPKITATEAGLLYCIEPIFGSILACTLPALLSAWLALQYANEQLTWNLLVGGGLITIANVLLQLRTLGWSALGTR